MTVQPVQRAAVGTFSTTAPVTTLYPQGPLQQTGSSVEKLLAGVTMPRANLYAAPARTAVNVLAIDGGGVYDVRAARIMQEIEQRTGKRASELFHMMSGTSGGSLLAGALAMPEPLTAKQTVELFRTRSNQIFSRNLWYQLRSFNGLFRKPRYPDQGLNDLLREFFGDTRMSQAKVDLLIPAYEQDLGPVALTSWAVGEGKEDHLLREVTRGSAAVPAVFTPGCLDTLDSPAAKKMKLLDGGLWATNPTLIAAQAAKHRNPEAQYFNIISLGLGKDRSSNVGDASSKWGLFQWAPYMLGAALGTPERMAEAQVAEYLEKGDVYVRLSPPVISSAADPERGVGAFDDGSRENMDRHLAQVEQWIADNSDAIDHVCQLLTTTPETNAEDAPAPRRVHEEPIYKAQTTRMLRLAETRCRTVIDRR